MTDKTVLRLVRLAEFLLISVMIYAATSSLSYGGESRKLAVPLSILPFLIVLCLENVFRAKMPWKLISAFHQGSVVGWGALGLIFLVVSFFPQNESIFKMWPFLLFCLVLVALQIGVAYLLERFKSEGGRGISFVRAFSVFYSGVLFLVLFK